MGAVDISALSDYVFLLLLKIQIFFFSHLGEKMEKEDLLYQHELLKIWTTTINSLTAWT